LTLQEKFTKLDLIDAMMRWFSGSNVMIVGPFLLSSKKLNLFSSWKMDLDRLDIFR